MSFRAFGGRSALAVTALSIVAVPFSLVLLLVQVGWTPLLSLDNSMRDRLHRYTVEHPTFAAAMKTMSAAGSAAVYLTGFALVAAWLLYRRRPRQAVFAVVTVTGSAVLNALVKRAVQRARPVVADPIATATGLSFPSGHAQSAVVTYTTLLLLCWPAMRSGWRAVAVIVAVGAVLGIGLSRVALAVHYVSDVLAGYLLGLAWIAVMVAVFGALAPGKRFQPVTRSNELLLKRSRECECLAPGLHRICPPAADGSTQRTFICRRYRMPESISQRSQVANTTPLPLAPLRVPQVDLGVEQQSDAKVRWLHEAKLGMFIHWGPYAGPAKGEWYMHSASVTPEDYRGYVTDATDEQFTASSYDPSDWARLATEMGAKYVVLTARHHDGFALFPNAHPNAWTSAQAPLNRDLVGEYVAAVRAAGLKVGLYFSPINWRYPGYYDVTGTDCAKNPWNYTTDPAHKENARIMKNEVYQAVRELVTRYGVIDDFWWDGGWIAEQGTDADGAFFWEPGLFRDAANQWPVDSAFSESDPATGQPLGLTGLVRRHQPGILATSRSGWIGDYTSEEGDWVPTGPIRTGKVAEKCFSVGGAWGYDGDRAMSYGDTMEVLVNSWIRDMTCLVNVGPDRTGVVPPSQAGLMRRIGTYLSTYGASVYGTRGGPWEPVDGQYGFTWRDNTFYVHLLPGYRGTTFTTPSIGDARVSRVFDVATGASLSHTVSETGQVTVTGVDRTRHPEDSVVGVTLDRSVQPADIAAGRTATASAEGDTAANAVDSSTSTRWRADDGATGHWLKVDLGSPRSITGVRIAWELDATNYRYLIEGSADDSTWTTLADRTATTSTSQVQVAVFSARARYVRVTVTGLPSGVRASIRAFEVYDRPFAATGE